VRAEGDQAEDDRHVDETGAAEDQQVKRVAEVREDDDAQREQRFEKDRSEERQLEIALGAVDVAQGVGAHLLEIVHDFLPLIEDGDDDRRRDEEIDDEKENQSGS
jgi:hypothetical protein